MRGLAYGLMCVSFLPMAIFPLMWGVEGPNIWEASGDAPEHAAMAMLSGIAMSVMLIGSAAALLVAMVAFRKEDAAFRRQIFGWFAVAASGFVVVLLVTPTRAGGSRLFGVALWLAAMVLSVTPVMWSYKWWKAKARPEGNR